MQLTVRQLRELILAETPLQPGEALHLERTAKKVKRAVDKLVDGLYLVNGAIDIAQAAEDLELVQQLSPYKQTLVELINKLSGHSRSPVRFRR